MKRLTMFLSMLLAVAVAAAVLAPVAMAAKTHQVKGEIVSVDVPSKAITFKDDKGENHTAPLMGKAVDMAKSLKAGDKVTLTCTDTDQGVHEGVTDIKVEKA
jgi:translation initiation factor IF-1